MTQEIYSPGLEGVIAGETEVCSVEQGGLFYRGYSISDLAQHSTFEETAYLVLHGELPDKAQLQEFRRVLDEHRALPKPMVEILRQIPRTTNAMAVLRSATSAVGHFDPVPGEDRSAWHHRTIHLISRIGSLITTWQRIKHGQDPLAPKPGLTHAEQILYMLRGEIPDPEAARLLDLTLILYMEHEFNASTFVARVTASTLSDLISCVVGGIGALKGPLHGGANEEAMEMLQQFDSADQARQWTLDTIASKGKIMGFGHRVYKHGDHRAHILEARMRALAARLGETKWLGIYDAVKNTMDQEKHIFPNLDYPCGLTYYLLKLPIEIYTPLFVASRVVGWCAHAIEQHFNNRIIRPRSRYTGYANRPYIPLVQRGIAD
ncbi:MAG: 2-methylcitrate synthase 1 [Phycisphaerae bacterium]|nr:2-methylcitrate synthase 1 [Phycisphaerae bacterium]